MYKDIYINIQEKIFYNFGQCIFSVVKYGREYWRIFQKKKVQWDQVSEGGVEGFCRVEGEGFGAVIVGYCSKVISGGKELEENRVFFDNR